MKVFAVNEKPPEKKTTRKGGVRKTVKKKKPEFKRESLTPDQIRAKVEANTVKADLKHKLTKERMDKFKAEKLPDLDEAERAIVGDVGVNDPNDLATHGKLKNVLSMGAFSFSDKERAALEKILKD